MSKLEAYQELSLRYEQFTFHVPRDIAVLYQDALHNAARYVDEEEMTKLDRAVHDLLTADAEMLKTTTDKGRWREKRERAANLLGHLLDKGETE